MIEIIEKADQSLFLVINGFNSPLIDPIIGFLTTTWAWIPLYLILLWKIISKYKKHAIAILVGIALVVTLSDQFTSRFMKPNFKRLRPCYEPALSGKVHTPFHCGGEYGFCSSHAANTAGVAFLIYLLLINTNKLIGFVFLWPIFVSYTRIYLGVHYPLDVLMGALVGIIIALVIYLLLKIGYFNKYKIGIS
ncbi:MAG: phosphatase PAP2 family protein [Bacteroidota bacterium]|nr:phosphatase PAP2 family protein [Bacteroidota bacterium]